MVLAKIPGDTLARHPAYSRADVLYDNHQRVRKQHGPRQLIFELRSGLRIGRDPAGIVVRCTGDQSRPKGRPKANLRFVCRGSQRSYSLVWDRLREVNPGDAFRVDSERQRTSPTTPEMHDWKPNLLKVPHGALDIVSLFPHYGKGN